MATGTQLRHLVLSLLVAAIASLVLPADSPAAKGEREAWAQGSQGTPRIDLGAGRRAAGQGRCSTRWLKQRSTQRIERAKLNRLKGRQARVKKRQHRIKQRRLYRIAKRCKRSAKSVAKRTKHSPSPLYWGAWISDQLTGEQAPWDMRAVDAFEGLAQKRLSVIQFAAPFANCSRKPCSFYDFPADPMDNIREHGAIPLLGWTSQAIPSNLNQPDFQLSDVISGAHDEYIREFAEDARDWGHPFFLRFNWEMNGDWFSWSEGVNGNQPGEYVAAWRRVHDIFAEVGATNVSWVWCPWVDPQNKLQNLASLYPGDAYVDWTGLDGYNWGTHPARRDRWRSFDEIFRPTYELITETVAPSKPMIIGEVGSTEVGGSKAAWITDMLRTVPVYYPKIRGLVWFEKFDDGMDWPIETSSDAAGAFAGGIQDPVYMSNQYGGLGASPIPPPS